MADKVAADFLHPTKKCDIVMKGGITSGVVYPNTVCKLAETYRFVNIGGTSAGAIAAAATAAAEYRRASGSDMGFAKLADLPDFLSRKPAGERHTNLYYLFQPDPAARLLFNVGVSFTKKGAAVLTSLLAALLRGAALAWLIVVVLGLLYLFHPAFAESRHSAFANISAGVWLLLLLAFGLATKVFRDLVKLPPTGFGLCSGRTVQGSGPPALTDWLHEFLNDLAGKTPKEPLTFGDLHKKGIQLRMITTCATHGRPYGLPIDTANFYFREEELAAYFPPCVMDWMKAHPGPPPKERKSDPIDTTGFCRLPHATDLPVVVAARMSLSFPFLFRAVPLYTVDYTLLRRKEPDPKLTSKPGSALEPDQPRAPERCWFLDGGICSNFPITMFDAPLPRWPTFGIDLQSVRTDRPDSLVWLPEQNKEGFGEQWDRIPDKTAFGPLFRYIVAIVSAARNWTDTRQMTVPGYRDRIVYIRLDDKKEGGLNLDMSPEIVTTISERGRAAADLLLDHFAYPQPDVSLTWDNHRWIRFRSILAQLESLLTGVRNGFLNSEPGERTYTELLNRSADEPPNSYRITRAQREITLDCVNRLIEIAATIQEEPPKLRPDHNAPRPRPALRILPRTVPEIDADRPDTAPVDPPNEGDRSLRPPAVDATS